MTFAGRGFRSPQLSYTATEKVITVRVDCDENPEAWCEVRITFEDLLRMTGMMSGVRRVEPFSATEPELGGEG